MTNIFAALDITDIKREGSFAFESKEVSIVESNKESIRSDVRTFHKSKIKLTNPTTIP